MDASNCFKCDLHHSRKNSVPGSGPENAEIMFIGEGPRFHENEIGQPFAGPSGNLLDELLKKINMKRRHIFITNVVKCRPPGNREPSYTELSACSSKLDKQIQAINPKVIVTLGRTSMNKFLPFAKIDEAHGQAVKVRGRLIVPFYHPASALDQPSLRSILEDDFKKLPKLIKQAAKMPEFVEQTIDEGEDKHEQLSLF